MSRQTVRKSSQAAQYVSLRSLMVHIMNFTELIVPDRQGEAGLHPCGCLSSEELPPP